MEFTAQGRGGDSPCTQPGARQLSGERAGPMTLGRVEGLGLPGTITEIFAQVLTLEWTFTDEQKFERQMKVFQKERMA